MENNIKLGICWEGMEQHYINLLQAANKNPLYVEVGMGYGQTMAGVMGILGGNATYVGIDVDGWCGGGIPTVRSVDQCKFDKGGVCVITSGSHAALSAWPKDMPIDFLLVDGCHCIDCCAKDFLLAKDKCAVGCIVVFHDYATAQQGTQKQYNHGNIEVIQATVNVGLVNGEEKDWTPIQVCHSDTHEWAFGWTMKER